MNKTTYEVLSKEDALNLIGKQWMLVTAGSKDSYNTMTASWGGIGWLWNKAVAFVFVRPERYTHEFIEKNDRLTLSFYTEEYRSALQLCGTKSGRDTDKAAETGLTPLSLESGAMTFEQARLTLDCKKLFKASMEEANFLDKELVERWYGAHGGMHDVYVVEIETVYEK
ncbi:MAG: flavin reductase [Bacteroidia bacterium]|nr:flavin reductase [Bacteroidia bacterium]